MLLRAYEPTQSTHKNNSDDSINLILDLSWTALDVVDLFFRKTFDYVDVFGIFESIELIQSYEPLKVNRLNHLLNEKMTQSPINSLGKGTDTIQSILWKN